MNSWVMGLGLVCLTVIAGVALWHSPDVGKDVALTAVGAIGGALGMKAYTATAG